MYLVLTLLDAAEIFSAVSECISSSTLYLLVSILDSGEYVLMFLSFTIYTGKLSLTSLSSSLR